LPGIVSAPFTHRSTFTGTNDTGRLALGALAGQPAQATSPAATCPPLTVGTGAAVDDGAGEAVGPLVGPLVAVPPAAVLPAVLPALPPAVPPAAVPPDALGPAPVPADVLLTLAVPHPAASAPATTSPVATAHTRRPGRVIDAIGVLISVPRFYGHHLDASRPATGFMRLGLLPWTLSRMM
jgi:hypothetical protein